MPEFRPPVKNYPYVLGVVTWLGPPLHLYAQTHASGHVPFQQGGMLTASTASSAAYHVRDVVVRRRASRQTLDLQQSLESILHLNGLLEGLEWLDQRRV